MKAPQRAPVDAAQLELKRRLRLLPPAPIETLLDGTPIPKPLPAPRCPRCRAPMIRKRIGKGTGWNGNPNFWSCARYPYCKGRRPFPPVKR